MVYRTTHEDEGDLHVGSRVCTKCSTRKDITEFHWTRNQQHRRRTCKLCARERQKDVRHANPEQYKLAGQRRHLKRVYGITPEDYLALLDSQQGRCAICRDEFKETVDKVPHVDHCHTTGAVRGILCFTCNTALGKFRDDVDLLKSAIKYLTE